MHAKIQAVLLLMGWMVGTAAYAQDVSETGLSEKPTQEVDTLESRPEVREEEEVLSELRDLTSTVAQDKQQYCQQIRQQVGEQAAQDLQCP